MYVCTAAAAAAVRVRKKNRSNEKTDRQADIRQTDSHMVRSRLTLSDRRGVFFYAGFAREKKIKNTNHSLFVCDASPVRRKAKYCNLRAHTIIYSIIYIHVCVCVYIY